MALYYSLYTDANGWTSPIMIADDKTGDFNPTLDVTTDGVPVVIWQNAKNIGHMAVTKIKPIKSTLKKALDYIMNPDKTAGKLLVSSFGCAYETADIEFAFTLSQAIEKGNNQAHHLIQSFSPDECKDGLLTPEIAHEIGVKLAGGVTHGKHEYVIATHTDRGHIHNHIIFCAADFLEHKKYVSNKKSYAEIRRISDGLCLEYGLSVVEPMEQPAKSYYEYQAEKMGISWKKKLRTNIDFLIPQVSGFDELLAHLQNAGYEIRYGQYISCRAPEQKRFTRLKTLGTEYAEERLRERITQKQHVSAPSLVIDIENSIKAQSSKGYEHWAKLHNLKQAANTINFLAENGITTYAAFLSRMADAEHATESLQSDIKETEQKLSVLSVIRKHAEVYEKTKAVYREYRQAKNKAQFRTTHERTILLHEASVKGLQDAGVKTVPNIAEIAKQYHALEDEKNRLYEAYAHAKKRSAEFSVIRKNMEQLLNPREKEDRANEI